MQERGRATLNIQPFDGQIGKHYDGNGGTEYPLERSRIEKQCRTIHLQRSNMGMTETQQIPVAALQFLFKIRRLMTVQKSDSFARQFNRTEPTMQTIAGFFGSKPERFVLAIHISKDEMGFDPLKRFDDRTAAHVAAVDDRLNVMFPKQLYGKNRFVQKSMRVTNNAEF